MKKTARSLLITALILFCAGLLLALSAALYAKLTDTEVFEVEITDKKIESKSITLSDILAKSPEANFVKKLSKTEFVQIDITSFCGNIKICTGAEKTELVLDKADTNNLKYEIVGGTLKIEEINPIGFFGIYIGENGLSFKGLRHIFASDNRFNTNSTITLNLKKDTALKELNIDSYLGSVVLDDVNAETINVKASIGNVKLDNLKNPDTKVNVNGTITNVKLNKSNYASCSINTRFGNVSANLPEQVGQSTIVDLWCGDVSMKTDLPTSFYKFSVSTGLGTVKKNNENFGKKLSESGSTASRISSGIILGNFTVSFNGKNEADYKPNQVEPIPEVTLAPEVTTIPEISTIPENTEIPTT